MIILSRGEDLYASDLEAQIASHPDIKAAIIGGDGRPRPFLIVQMTEDPVLIGNENEKEKILNKLWPVIETANERCSEYVSLSKDLVIFTEPGKALERTAKGTISRQQSIALYLEEAERLYSV